MHSAWAPLLSVQASALDASACRAIGAASARNAKARSARIDLLSIVASSSAIPMRDLTSRRVALSSNARWPATRQLGQELVRLTNRWSLGIHWRAVHAFRLR